MKRKLFLGEELFESLLWARCVLQIGMIGAGHVQTLRCLIQIHAVVVIDGPVTVLFESVFVF